MVHTFTPCKPFLSPGLTEFYYIRQYIRKHEVLYDSSPWWIAKLDINSAFSILQQTLQVEPAREASEVEVTQDTPQTTSGQLASERVQVKLAVSVVDGN